MVATEGDLARHYVLFSLLRWFEFRKTLLDPPGPLWSSADDISLLLSHWPDPEDPKEWHACVQFALVISNPHDKALYTSQSEVSMRVGSTHLIDLTGSCYRFNPQWKEWGFRNFSTATQLLTVQELHTRPIVENELVDITAFVRVLDDRTGMLWRDFAK